MITKETQKLIDETVDQILKPLLKPTRKAIFGKSGSAEGDNFNMTKENATENFKSFGHFAQEVIQAELSGASANLLDYTSKSVMQEGDLAQGG